MRRSGTTARFDSLGGVLRLLREKQGRGQAAVARAAGLPASSLCKYEAGVAVPTVGNLGKLLDALGLSAADFGAAIDDASGYRRSGQAGDPEAPAATNPPLPPEVDVVAEILLGATGPELSPAARRAFGEALEALRRFSRALKPGAAPETEAEKAG
jgi:transcriptional regulator with XRE-family HTH domain